MFNMRHGIDIEVYADMYEDLLEDLSAANLLEDFANMLAEDDVHDDTVWKDYNPDEYNILPQ